MDDVVVNKCATIERCIRRVHEEYAGEPLHLRADFAKQDSMILNIQRACEACIDLAMHLVRKHRLGVPQRTRDAFDFLVSGRLLSAEEAAALKKMVGFRNVAVHDYQALNLDIVQSIIERRLTDLSGFATWALKNEG